MSKLFKTLYGYLLSQLFLLSFLVNLLLTPIHVSISGNCDVKQLPLIIFNKCLTAVYLNEFWVIRMH